MKHHGESRDSAHGASMLSAVLLAIRPKTLTAALVPLIVSTALVRALNYQIDWSVIAYAGGASFLIQIATNLINDAIDCLKGADTAARLGPTRVTQSGLLSGSVVMRGGIVCLVIALLLGVPLVLKGGVPILAIGISALVLAYAYTGGPCPLAYRGLGDLFVLLFFGVIAVSGLVYLHTGAWLLDALVAGVQVGALATVLIAVNNARDIEGDRAAGKWTVAARWGVDFVRNEIVLLFVVSFALNFYWNLVRDWWLVWGAVLALPPAVIAIRIVATHPPSETYNTALAQSALAHLVFGVMLSVGIVLS